MIISFSDFQEIMITLEIRFKMEIETYFVLYIEQ